MSYVASHWLMLSQARRKPTDESAALPNTIQDTLVFGTSIPSYFYGVIALPTTRFSTTTNKQCHPSYEI
eukprot:scaffold275_cov221-Alexandrium_tamarense.AAC.14